MGKKKGQGKNGNTKKRMKEKAAGERQNKKPGQFLTATLEELILAINELPDGIILEVYFD